MMLPQRLESVLPNNLQGTGVLGTKVPVTLNRTWPIEEILVICTVTVNAQLTLTGADNILGLVKLFDLQVNDNTQPRSIVQASGIGLLEYASQVGLNLDRATLAAVSLSQGSTVAASMTYRLMYRIPMVHPQIAEPLRTRMLLPCHTWDQDLTLNITFEAGANMFSAGSLSALQTEVILVRRQMDVATTKKIQDTGGFINFDLIESNYAVPVGSSADLRLRVPTPGSYLGLLMRTYKGAATVVRDVIDQTTTPGAETLWDLETGGVTFRQWRMKTLQNINDLSRVANGVNQTYSPNFAGAVAANTSFQPASSVYLDFLGDGVGESANELGSVLDCNLPTKSGLLMEIVGKVSAPVTNGHQIYLLGHRLYGDLGKYQII